MCVVGYMWDMCAVVGSSWGYLGLAQPSRPTNTTPSGRLVALRLPARLPGGAQTLPHRGLALLGQLSKHAQVARFHLAWAGHGLGNGPESPSPIFQTCPKAPCPCPVLLACCSWCLLDLEAACLASLVASGQFLTFVYAPASSRAYAYILVVREGRSQLSSNTCFLVPRVRGVTFHQHDSLG
jgi:hypothetical protein